LPPASTFSDSAADPPVRGFLHLPDASNGRGLVLTHGAGSNANAPLLIALAETFSTAGFTVLRCNLPYRQARSYGPPGPGDAARDRAGLKNAIAALTKILSAAFAEGGPPNAAFVGWGEKALEENAVAPPFSRSARKGGESDKTVGAPSYPRSLRIGWDHIFLSGHSYGGRQASILCAEEPGLVPGLLLLSYPLHPPRRPEQQRTAHLPSLRTPALFVHGTRDPFGSVAEIEQALKMIPAPTRLLTVEGAGHDLGFKGKARQEILPGQILDVFTSFAELSS